MQRALVSISCNENKTKLWGGEKKPEYNKVEPLEEER